MENLLEQKANLRLPTHPILSSPRPRNSKPQFFSQAPTLSDPLHPSQRDQGIEVTFLPYTRLEVNPGSEKKESLRSFFQAWRPDLVTSLHALFFYISFSWRC